MTEPDAPLMIATCWTTAGDVAPLDPSELSPVPIEERVRAVAATGWGGIGLAQDDLREVQRTIGFEALRDLVAEVGLVHTEVEVLGDWWTTGERRTASDETRAMLLEAAEVLGAPFIKVGTAHGAPEPDEASQVARLAEAFHDLAAEAATVGTRVAIEPLPFSLVRSIPMGADLVRAADHPSAGMVIDAWHVFRAGTTVAEVGACLEADAAGRPGIEMVCGVELDDARAEQVGATLFEDTAHHRLHCGRGSFDLVGLVRTLHDLGYAGGWGVEILSAEHRKAPYESSLAEAYECGLAVVKAGLAR